VCIDLVATKRNNKPKTWTGTVINQSKTSLFVPEIFHSFSSLGDTFLSFPSAEYASSFSLSKSAMAKDDGRETPTRGHARARAFWGFDWM
jgi:hypothetical protein